MKKRWKLFLGVWLVGAFIIGSGQYIGIRGASNLADVHRTQAAGSSTMSPQSSPEYSGGLQDQLDAAQKKRQELQQEQKQVEDEIERVQSVADNVKKYVQILDAQFNRLMHNIEINRESIQKMKAEVEAVNRDYELAQEKQQSQYESMKARIKYMYENSDNSYLQFLLESRSLAELFSREEYIEKITAYDKTLFLRYQSVFDEMTVAKQRAQDKLNEVEATKETLKFEKETMKKMTEEKDRQIQMYKGLLQDGQQNINDYAQQIASQEQQIETILQKQREKVAAQETETDEGKRVVPTTGDYAWPLPVRGRISSGFGYRSSPTAGASSYHKGVDIAISMGTSVLATKEGKVVTAKYSPSAGNYVAIYHGGGLYSYYMHCSSLQVSAGAKVEKGQVIARSGSTGISTGPHLHFAIYKGGAYVNPMFYVSQPAA